MVTAFELRLNISDVEITGIICVGVSLSSLQLLTSMNKSPNKMIEPLKSCSVVFITKMVFGLCYIGVF